MASDNLTIGGVSFNRNDLKLPQIPEGADLESVFKQKDGKFKVELKDGTVLQFRKQYDTQEAKVSMTDDGNVNFYGLRCADIIDTPENDKYNLMGCMGCYIHANRTNVKTKKGGIFHPDKVIHSAADKDVIKQYDRTMPDGSIQKSKDNMATALKGDTVDKKIAVQPTLFDLPPITAMNVYEVDGKETKDLNL